MSNVREKREQVLEKLYDKLLESNLDEFKLNAYSGSGPEGKKGQHPMVQLIATLEEAKAADEKIVLEGDVLAFDNANHEIDRTHEAKMEVAKLLATAGVTVITNVAWGMIFVHELKATRQFEVDGTETSAAGRWLKNSFPKMRTL